MSRENVEIVRRWMEGLNQEGVPPLDLCDEQIQIGNVKEFVVQGPYHGHAGVREWVTDAFDVISDRRFELEEAIDGGDGETVVTVQRALGHSTHTGLKFDLSWAAVWTIRSGKVVHIQGYLTKGAALEAVRLRE
jgi:ketosteroid isomerase-like protein